MGVPKFFRFLIDRYPCVIKTIKEHEIPMYDNLYLDMNSIVHICSHPTDSDVYFRISKKEFSDDDIFQSVFRYVDLIFHIIKPLKMMFLAFDGVTPRAKINQQRANRFRVARKINDETDTEEKLDDEELIDTNCITPGTTFMVELIEQMRHFVAYKVSTDPMWQKCKIILSGPEVPGEGEHKIMQHLRFKKAQPNYNVNTRHCVYSLDADMIMLGLCSHEIHFSLIQETVRFGKRKILQTPEESDFHLLHLCIVREYLEREFKCLFNEQNIKKQFDLEKIIDDWLLIGFLVGNDFIPQLPNFNIIEGALPFLYRVYVEIFPSLNGYINEAGILNLERFEQYLVYLSSFEKTLILDSTKTKTEYLNDQNDSKETKCDCLLSNDKEADIQDLKLKDLNLNDPNYLANTEYYKEKLKVENFEQTEINTMVEEYIRAIQWTLSYYYKGCISWSWYYPYHYAPYINDIKNIKNVNLKFDLSKPFLPLEHLLAVLPPTSSHLLPKAYRHLVTSKTSPIIDFYPSDFEIDFNGKTNEWEAVVILPFIDEKKLLEASKSCQNLLNKRDLSRNKTGDTCIYTYTETSLGNYPVNTIYNDFINHAQLKYAKLEDLFVPYDKLVKGLSNKVSVNARFPGFPLMDRPSLITSSFMKLKKNTVPPTAVTFMCLTVQPMPQLYLDEIAKNFLQQKVYINWPYHQEAYVIGVTDFKDKIMLKNFWRKYEGDNIDRIKVTQHMMNGMKKDSDAIVERYQNVMGINIGKTNVLAYVFPSLGKRYICDAHGNVNIQEKWSTISEVHPYQLIQKNITQLESPPLFKTVKDVFTPSSPCFVIGHPHYGTMGTVTKLFLGQQKVVVNLTFSNEPDFTLLDRKIFVDGTVYMNSNVVAEKLNVTSKLINRVTGSIFVKVDSDQKYFDIGLRMKSPKHNRELSEYTKRKNDQWLYSDKAIQLIKNYIEKFPDFFDNLKKNIAADIFQVSEIFPEDPSKLSQVFSWVSEQITNYPAFCDCYTTNIGTKGVQKVEKFVTNFYMETKTVEMSYPYTSLFRPGTTTGLVSPDLKADHKLLDRIICIKENFTVPLGLKGTIIGIKEKENRLKNVFEVLFDSSFTGGLCLYSSSEHRCYRMTIADFINISHGQRDVNNNRRKENSRSQNDNINSRNENSKSNSNKAARSKSDGLNSRNQNTNKNSSNNLRDARCKNDKTGPKKQNSINNLTNASKDISNESTGAKRDEVCPQNQNRKYNSNNVPKKSFNNGTRNANNEYSGGKRDQVRPQNPNRKHDSNKAPKNSYNNGNKSTHNESTVADKNEVRSYNRNKPNSNNSNKNNSTNGANNNRPHDKPSQ